MEPTKSSLQCKRALDLSQSCDGREHYDRNYAKRPYWCPPGVETPLIVPHGATEPLAATSPEEPYSLNSNSVMDSHAQEIGMDNPGYDDDNHFSSGDEQCLYPNISALQRPSATPSMTSQSSTLEECICFGMVRVLAEIFFLNF